MQNWLVVANAARARVFEDAAKGKALRPVADLVHTPSRQRGAELGFDRAGRVDGQGQSMSGSAYAPRTGAREREHDRFAREVAALLDRGIADGSCAALVLVASNPFLGQLKSHLGAQAAKAVLRTVASDYTTLPEDEIARRVHAEPGG